MVNFAVFASGSGSNFQSIVDAVSRNEIPGKCRLLICDKPEAKVLKRAEQAGIPAIVFDPKKFESKADYEQAILEKLKEYQIQFIALAGYMRLVGSVLLDAYDRKIVNVHPSLLPAFPGLDAVGQAIKAGVKVTGVTIHYVDSGMDTGPIIAQQAVEISEGDSREELMRKIHAAEHGLYPRTLAKLFQTIKEAPLSK